MASKPISTSSKIANLEKVKSQRVAKIEEDITAQLSPLLAKRKDEIFDIFQKHSATNIDDKLLIGFLKFVANTDNQTHPIISEFLNLAKSGKLYQKKSFN